MAYESRRDYFEKILKKYLDYVNLYRKVNNGKVEGVTTFEDFYWRFTYYNRYEDPTKNHGGGR